jgi:acetyltransferase-like isoleucine patch superfamily enzyme
VAGGAGDGRGFRNVEVRIPMARSTASSIEDETKAHDGAVWSRIADAETAAPRLGPRDLTQYVRGAPNMHALWYTVRKHKDGVALGLLKILRNYVVIEAMKHFPSLLVKRLVFKWVLGMKLGKGVTISPGCVMDYFFPELTEIGDNTILGLGAVVITHEFLHDRFRLGPVRIGENTMIGAHSMVLAGVTIGSNVQVSAMSFVNQSVPDNAFVRGNPIQIVRMRPNA